MQIEAWARRTGAEPTPWEVSVLRRMDTANRIAAASKKGQEGTGSVADASDPEQMRAAMRALMGRVE